MGYLNKSTIKSCVK